MQKISNNFLTFYYETFSFIMPRNFSANEQLTAQRFKNWSFLESFKHITQLRTIFKVLHKISYENEKNGCKSFFIIDESLFPFFETFLKTNNCFFTKDIKEALVFMNTKQSFLISSVIYIGFLDNLSGSFTTSWECPSFFFVPKILYKNSYIAYNSLNFQGSLLFLKSLLSETLFNHEKGI